MKLVILGGGSCQLNAIKRAKEKGHTVIVVDYYPDAPGKQLADIGELTSTFDVAGNLRVAEKYDIDGIMTTGTDQPVYTAVKVATEFGLPVLVDLATAKALTNKKVMKRTFQAKGIPTVDFRFLSKDFNPDDLAELNFPVVIKPLDSQGQRGVFKLNSKEEISNHFAQVLSFSREEEILLEEYYESNEITVSGWVKDGQLYLLTITDRHTYENPPHIGICTAHLFPSRYLKKYYDQIQEISVRIVEGFNISNGPIYFQMLVGSQGIKVNEVAGRIGGAYEDVFIPLLTGVNILDMVIDSALGREIDELALKSYQLRKTNQRLSVQLLFARSGEIAGFSDLNDLKNLPGVITAGFNFKVGDQIGQIENATQRAGYLIVQGQSQNSLKDNLNLAFDHIKIYDREGKNLIIRPKI